jgi:hypothetical protein
VTCQLLVTMSFATNVVMQTINTKIIPKCSIVVMKLLNLRKALSAVVLSKQSSIRLASSLPPSV